MPYLATVDYSGNGSPRANHNQQNKPMKKFVFKFVMQQAQLSSEPEVLSVMIEVRATGIGPATTAATPAADALRAIGFVLHWVKDI